MNDNIILYGKMVEEIVEEIVFKYDFFVCYYFFVGYVKDNWVLIMG